MVHQNSSSRKRGSAMHNPHDIIRTIVLRIKIKKASIPKCLML
nr:MAG TPA: hypothetical protein [Caudoviricetes sp.]